MNQFVKKLRYSQLSDGLLALIKRCSVQTLFLAEEINRFQPLIVQHSNFFKLYNQLAYIGKFFLLS